MSNSTQQAIDATNAMVSRLNDIVREDIERIIKGCKNADEQKIYQRNYKR